MLLPNRDERQRRFRFELVCEYRSDRASTRKFAFCLSPHEMCHQERHKALEIATSPTFDHCRPPDILRGVAPCTPWLALDLQLGNVFVGGSRSIAPPCRLFIPRVIREPLGFRPAHRPPRHALHPWRHPDVTRSMTPMHPPPISDPTPTTHEAAFWCHPPTLARLTFHSTENRGEPKSGVQPVHTLVIVTAPARGFPVWCDLTKLLGGEDFWRDGQGTEQRAAWCRM